MRLENLLESRRIAFWLFTFTILMLSFGCSKLVTENKTDSPLNEPRAENEFEGDQQKREDWFLKQRTYPFDRIPDDARRKAFEEKPADAVDNLLGGGQWQPIGPLPTTSDIPNWGLTSGRINTIAVSPTNPQIVLVGGATGGIWRSVDGGNTFAPTSDSQVDLAVGSIAFAPSNSSIVYAGMGDKAGSYLGSGVLKSTNSGQTWTRINNATLPSPGRVSQILVHPTNPDIVYVAQYVNLNGGNLFASGFYYSTNGGVNWTKTLSGLPRDMAQHPTQANTIYLAMQRVDGANPTTGGIFKSTDSGLTWTRTYTSPFAATSNIKIATTPAAPTNLYVLVGDGANPRVEISTNEGGTFTNMGTGTGFDGGQFDYNLYLFVHPTDANTIYVGTRDLWRTTDGGMTYTNITGNFQLNGDYTPGQSKAHPDQHHFYQLPTTPNTMFIANDGGLYRTTDNAVTFTSQNATLSLTMFTGLDVHPTDAARSYGGAQDNGTQKRTGNTSWREFTSGDGGYTVIDAVDPTIVFSTYIEKDISRWTNNAENFDGQVGFQSCMGCVDMVFGNDPVAFYPPFTGNGVNSNLYFGTNRLWVSTNRGNTWAVPGGATVLTNGGLLSAIGVGKSDTNTIYTGSDDGKLMVSSNGGTNWTDRSAGLPDRTIKSVIVSPTNANTAYVTVSGFMSGHVFKTTNAGANWTDISGNLPDIPTNTLLISPTTPTTLYVGTDIGVFRSTTDGTTWETFNNGMPPAIISELTAQAGGLIQAGTYGRGAYQLNPNSNRKTRFDLDGDSKADIGIFRPGPGQWWYLRSSDNGNRAFQFGAGTDLRVPADFTGDGATDIGFFRPSTGQWFVLRSEDNSFFAFDFGANGDVPVPGDFDGDGKADAAVFRPSNATYYIIKSSDSGLIIQQFGQNGDVPIINDYDGDGKDDIANFRPSVAEWYLQRSTAGYIGFQFGTSNDTTPTPADFTGDGKADIAFFKPSASGGANNWFVLRSEDFSFFAFPFGVSTDIPVPGDYDGDGKADPAVFRPSNFTWYLERTTAGFTAVQFGIAGDKPIPSSYIPGG